ncbi:acyl carrier protein [Micromonospora lupini]|uniref:acyl carrier protein n=1 Tax=Micromonospora lupini TaxID=285679 RepID=UPI0033E18C17
MTPAQRWARELGALIREVAGFDVPPMTSFFDAGLTSVLLVAVHRRLVDQFRTDVPVTVFFKYPSRCALGAFLAGGQSAPDGTLPVASGAGVTGSAPEGEGERSPDARRWSAQDRRDLRSRLRQRKG